MFCGGARYDGMGRVTSWKSTELHSPWTNNPVLLQAAPAIGSPPVSLQQQPLEPQPSSSLDSTQSTGTQSTSPLSSLSNTSLQTTEPGAGEAIAWTDNDYGSNGTSRRTDVG